MANINIDFTPIGAIGAAAQRAGEGVAFNRRFQQEQQLVGQALQRQQAGRQARQAEAQLRNQAAELNLRQRSEAIQNALNQRQQQLRERQQNFQEQQTLRQQEQQQRPQPIDPREQIDFMQERLKLQRQQREEQAFQGLSPEQQQRLLRERIGVEPPQQQGPSRGEATNRAADLLQLQERLQSQLQQPGIPQERVDLLQQQINQIQEALGPVLGQALSQQPQQPVPQQAQQIGRQANTITLNGREVPVRPLPNDPSQLEQGAVYELPQGPHVFQGDEFVPVD